MKNSAVPLNAFFWTNTVSLILRCAESSLTLLGFLWKLYLLISVMSCKVSHPVEVNFFIPSHWNITKNVQPQEGNGKHYQDLLKTNHRETRQALVESLFCWDLKEVCLNLQASRSRSVVEKMLIYLIWSFVRISSHILKNDPNCFAFAV